MSIQRIDSARLTEAVKALATTARTLRLATQVFHDFEQFAGGSWDASCYACFDWVALSRRMFRNTLLSFEDLRGQHGPVFENPSEVAVSIEWCRAQVANIRERHWFEENFCRPTAITDTLNGILLRLDHALELILSNVGKSGPEGEWTDTSPESLLGLSIVQAVLEKTPTSEEILADPSASFWLKNALRTALARDPVDAANDAQVLASVLDFRCEQILKASDAAAAGHLSLIHNNPRPNRLYKDVEIHCTCNKKE